MTLTPEQIDKYREHKKRLKKAASRLEMINKHIGWLRKKYDLHTIFTRMEAAGFEQWECDAIHKLFYYEVDDPDTLNLLIENGAAVTNLILNIPD